MSDLIYLALVLGFFAAAVGLMRACEHIIGDDAPAVGRTDHQTAPETDPEAVAA